MIRKRIATGCYFAGLAGASVAFMLGRFVLAGLLVGMIGLVYLGLELFPASESDRSESTYGLITLSMLLFGASIAFDWQLGALLAMTLPPVVLALMSVFLGSEEDDDW